MSNRVLLTVLKPTEDLTGVIESFQFLDKRTELPLTGAIDYTIYNTGATNAYIYGGALKIPPGGFFTPKKTTPLPYSHGHVLTFDNDFQNTRNTSDQQFVEYSPGPSS